MFRAKRAKKEASAVAEEENMTEEVKQVKKERVLSSRQKGVEKGTMLALNIHAASAIAVCVMLFFINLLVGIITRKRTPWSLFVIAIWGSVVMLHYLVTYSIFVFFDIPTDELEAAEIANVAKRFWDKYGQPLLEHISTAGANGLKPLKASKAWKFLGQLQQEVVESAEAFLPSRSTIDIFLGTLNQLGNAVARVLQEGIKLTLNGR